MPLDKIYYENNLSAKSADLNIIPRNDGGNLIEVKDKFLYIEPMTYKYVNSTINDVLKTSFEYYKFPSRIIVVDEVDVDNLSFDDLDIADELNQPIKTRYKLSANQELPRLLTNSEYKLRLEEGTSNGRNKFITSTSNNRDTGDSLVNVSLKELEFNDVIEGNSQLIPNRFIVTQDILDANKDLKLTAQIAIKFSENSLGNNYIARLVQIDPDIPTPIVLDEQVSAAKYTRLNGSITGEGGYTLQEIQQLYINRETKLKQLYVNKNNYYNLTNELKDTQQNYQSSISKQVNAVVNFINGVLGTTQVNDKNENLWKRILFSKLTTLPDTKSADLTKQFNLLNDSLNQMRLEYNNKLNTIQQLMSNANTSISIAKQSVIEAQQLIDDRIGKYSLLVGAYGYLPGKDEAYFVQLDAIIDQSDLKLNNSYAIELVVGRSANSVYDDKSSEIKPTLLPDQSYWSINEI